MPQLRRLVPQALPPGFRSPPNNPEEAEASLVHSRKAGFVLSSLGRIHMAIHGHRLRGLTSEARPVCLLVGLNDPPDSSVHFWFSQLHRPKPLPLSPCLLIYLFLAVLDLHFCAWASSCCRKQRLLPRRGVRASHCRGFSWSQGGRASVVRVPGSLSVAHRLSCPAA